MIVVVVVAVVATSSAAHLDRILYQSSALLFDAMLDGPFFSMSGPSFRYFFSIPVKSFLFRESVLLATTFFTLVLRSIGLELASTVNRKIDNDDNALLRAPRSVLLATDAWIPTASVVRYYTVIQSLLECCGSLLSGQQTWCCS